MTCCQALRRSLRKTALGKVLMMSLSLKLARGSIVGCFAMAEEHSQVEDRWGELLSFGL